MQKKYCIPIIKNRKNDILTVIRSNITDYNYFEVWLDYIDELDEAFIEELKKLLKERLILLFRRQNLAEMKMGLGERLNMLSLLNNCQSIIDLDVFDQKEELEHIRNSRLEVKTIVSYHNFRETPNDKKLREIVDIMKIYKPSIFKISTRCNSRQDALRLLQLLLELKSRNLKCIVLGMGQFGVITRIFGTLWGNELIFAPEILAEKSAEGQLTRNQLRAIFSKLKE